MSGWRGVIPKPQKLTMERGVFELDSNSSISYPEAGRQAGILLQKLTHLEVAPGKGDIHLEEDSHVRGEEAYHLEISQAGIQISAATPAGFFYGAQTLRQLLPPEIEQQGIRRVVEIPCLRIEDRPRFQHRGFMLDVARHFFGPEEIKRIIDLLALQKINRFHWHLSDEQGWRIEIKKYPRLVEIGSKRKETQVGGWLLSKAVFDGLPYGGYYTQDEVREIVAYARENFIEIIPEIDAPGHASAAMAAYPDLSCSGEQIEVRTSVSTFANPMCAGKEPVFEFLTGVYAELAELFPYKTIHIGGDEVQKKAWKKCPHCRRRMVEARLRNTHELHGYFTDRVVNILHSLGCQVIGWNEMLHERLDKDVTNQFWFPFNKKRTITELKKGRKTIVSDFRGFYLDYAYNITPLEKTYTYEPHFKEISDEQARAILGVEGALWTEYVDSRQRIDWQMFPRMLAISEIGWTEKQEKDYQDFLGRLESLEPRLEALGVNPATRECYRQPRNRSLVPPILNILIAREHPGTSEYKKYNRELAGTTVIQEAQKTR